jgi:hypothetical protein
MPTYYADFDLTTGNNDGTTAANAWQTLQAAIDGLNGTQPVAGDIIYCTGTDTLSTAIDMDGNSGSDAAGPIRWIGCSDLTPTIDGTRAVIDANSAVASCIVTWTSAQNWFENFEFTGATGTGVDLSTNTADENNFINCIFHNNGAHGVDCDTGANSVVFIRCKFYSNTNDGFTNGGGTLTFFLCAFYSNGDSGIDASFAGSWHILGCLFFDNGDNDENCEVAGATLVAHCVFDGTGQTGETGLNYTNDYGNCAIMNRFTNLATGLNCGSNVVFYGWNLFDNNTTDVSNAGGSLTIPQDGTADTNQYDPDADDGYNNTATQDYNLKASRTFNGDGTDTVGFNVGS